MSTTVDKCRVCGVVATRSVRMLVGPWCAQFWRRTPFCDVHGPTKIGVARG